MKTGPRLKENRYLLAVLVLALALRWAAYAYFFFIYKTPGGLHLSPQADEARPYDILAGMLLNGSGLAPDLFDYRPPLQPFFIAAVYWLTGSEQPLVAAFAQTIVSATISLIGYALARQLGAPLAVRRLTALLIALDPASILMSIMLMAETLSNFCFAFCLLHLARLLTGRKLRDALASGGWLGLATLARPTPVYFIVVVLFVLAWLLPRWWRYAAAMGGVLAALVLPWYSRNYLYNNVFTLSTVGDFNLLFYRAAGVEYWATDESPDEVRIRLAYELDRRMGVAGPPETYDRLTFWENLAPSDPRRISMMRSMALEIFLAHPLIYVGLIPAGLFNMFAFVNWSRHLRYVELPLNLAFYLLAIAGGRLAWRRRDWPWLTLTLLPIVYFVSVTMIVQTTGLDTRARTVFAPCLALLAAEALVSVRLLDKTMTGRYNPAS